MKSVIALFVSLTTGLSLAATPQVKNVKAFQQYPWGKVCISFEVEWNIALSTGRDATPIMAKDMCARERDSVRLIFGNICYQTHNGSNQYEACGCFEYQIRATPSEEQIQKYLEDWARYCSKKGGRFPFVELIRQGVHIKTLSVFYSDVLQTLGKA